MPKSEANNKRILFPLEGMNRSGGIRVICQVANGLAEAGNRVVFLVPDYASIPPFPLSNTIRIIKISTGSIRFLKKTIYRLKLCILSVADSDVSVATGYKTAYYIYGSKIIRFSKVKLLYLIQHYEPVSHALALPQYSKLTRRILYLISRQTYRLPFIKVSVSSWVKEKVGGVSVSVIPNGVDLGVFKCQEKLNKEQVKFTVGVIGSPSFWKGFHIFEEAIAQITDAGENEFNVLVATVDRTLCTKIKRSKIIYPENDDELRNFYHQCDVFVFPSILEGFGLPPLEAMACGIPVIVTECGGVTEYCNNVNSILVEPENVSQIADSILLLKNDLALRQKLRSEGLETANKFSVDIMQLAHVCFVKNL